MSTEQELVELQQTLYTSSNLTRRWLHCTRRDWVNDALRPTVSHQHQRTIEVGLGSGVYVPILAKLYNEVVALDIKQAYLNHVSHLNGIHENLELKVEDNTASSMPDTTFDLTLCIEVVEYIPHSQSAPQNLMRYYQSCS